MSDETPLSFGDNVRIRLTPDAEAAGVAGLAGQVYGFTTPSQTGVRAIGEISDDIAYNVRFRDRGEALWFARDLLEFIDHAPGTEVRVGGASSKWVRTESGEWEEVPDNTPWRGWPQVITSMFRKRG